MPYSLIYNNGTTTTTYYYIINLQGDVMYLVDANGVQVAAYDYDPYGKVITSTGDLAEINPLRYRGYYYDTETGFYYLQSRYYDPEICRFINADSYACTGRGLIGCNMFAYCNNTPVNYIDIDGHDAVSVLEWWTNQMYWICDADGPYPFADFLYVGVIFALSIYITADSIQEDSFPSSTSTVEGSSAASIKPAKRKESKKSGKEKASDRPSWVDVSQIDFNQTAQQNATRLLNEKYGPGNWRKGPNSDFSRIVKWIQRSIFAYTLVRKGAGNIMQEK